jgi:hypothetical protein
MKRAIVTLASLITLAFTGAGCFGGPSNADVAAKNISTEAEQFRVRSPSSARPGLVNTPRAIWDCQTT